jgi:hypothetical protein
MKTEAIDITITFTVEEVNAVIDAMMAGMMHPALELRQTPLWLGILNELTEIVDRDEDVENFINCITCPEIDSADCFWMTDEVRDMVWQKCKD